MTKKEAYRAILGTLSDWEPYLLAESRLPGPRANLELAHAVADEGNETTFHQLLAYGPEQAPTNTPHEFLACCGVLGLGKLLAEGKLDELVTLRAFASDPRWRVREMVAMALQRWGSIDMAALLAEMADWYRKKIRLSA